MKKHNITQRYILSLIVDYIIFAAAIFPISTQMSEDTAIFLAPCIFGVFIIYLVQDKLLGGASIGKRLFSIKVINIDQNGKLTFIQSLVRKMLELLYIYKVFFWRLRIDIDKISGTHIVFRKSEYRRNNQLEPNSEKKKDFYSTQIVVLRIKAFIYDTLIISWAWILYFMYQIRSFRQFIDNLSSYANFWYPFTLYSIIVLYYISKDYFYKGSSLGKRRFGIMILDFEGKIPSKLQLFIRNLIWIGFFPVEIVLFSLKAVGVSDHLSYTRISLIPRKLTSDNRLKKVHK